MFIATLSINKRHLKCLVSGLKLKDSFVYAKQWFKIK